MPATASASVSAPRAADMRLCRTVSLCLRQRPGTGVDARELGSAVHTVCPDKCSYTRTVGTQWCQVNAPPCRCPGRQGAVLCAWVLAHAHWRSRTRQLAGRTTSAVVFGLTQNNVARSLAATCKTRLTDPA